MEVTSGRKKIKLTTTEAPPVPVVEEEDVRSVVYVVGQLNYSSPYSAAIFKIEIGRNGEVIGDHTKAKDRIVYVFDWKKYLDFESPPPCFSNVACDMVDHNIYLVCTYSGLGQGRENGSSQAPVHIFNTLTQQLTGLPVNSSSPLAAKPFPLPMAAGGKLYVYGQRMLTSVKVPQPTLECFNCKTLGWESASFNSASLKFQLQLPPQYELQRSMLVEGYAVVNNFLVISVADGNGGCAGNEFLYWKFSGSTNSSSNKWEKLVVSRDTKYYPFSGKAEFVDGVIYSYTECGLVAYPVEWPPRSEEEEGVFAISTPLVLGFPQLTSPPVGLGWYECDSESSFCFAYMGIGKRFCVIQTREEISVPDEQYVAVCVVEVSDDFSCLTTLSSTFCLLNISGLVSELYLTSCFVPSSSS